MSRPHTVSRSTDNLIFELDDRPALDVLLGDFGVDSVLALRGLAGDVHAALPVAGSDTADYVVRNLVGVDEDHGVVAIGAPVQDGDPIMFVRRDPQAAENDLRQSFENSRAGQGTTSKAALHFVLPAGRICSDVKTPSLNLSETSSAAFPLLVSMPTGRFAITVSTAIQVCSRYLFNLSGCTDKDEADCRVLAPPEYSWNIVAPSEQAEWRYL